MPKPKKPARTKSAAIKPPTIARDASTEQIAEILDLDRATVLRWTQEGLPHNKAPKGSKAGNQYNAAEVQAWMKANNRTGDVGRPVEKNDDLIKLKIRKEAALVNRYERENAVSAGELIDAAAEQLRDVQKITLVRNRLCGLGAAISPQLEGLDGSGRQMVIDRAVDDILQEFANE